jgi:hypothetical protein
VRRYSGNILRFLLLLLLLFLLLFANQVLLFEHCSKQTVDVVGRRVQIVNGTMISLA